MFWGLVMCSNIPAFLIGTICVFSFSRTDLFGYSRIFKGPSKWQQRLHYEFLFFYGKGTAFIHSAVASSLVLGRSSWILPCWSCWWKCLCLGKGTFPVQLEALVEPICWLCGLNLHWTLSSSYWLLLAGEECGKLRCSWEPEWFRFFGRILYLGRMM